MQKDGTLSFHFHPSARWTGLCFTVRCRGAVLRMELAPPGGVVERLIPDPAEPKEEVFILMCDVIIT